MNKVILLGRLTEDPYLSVTSSGKNICDFTLAVTKRFNHKEAHFINCRTWENNAEFLCNNFSKGQMVAVCGYLEPTSWEDEGVKKYRTYVVCDEIAFTGDMKK